MNAVPAKDAAELRVENVGLDFAGNRALIAVTIAFSAGVPVAVTGPSGSGKSALCFVLAGAVEPTQGGVLFEGHPISSAFREDIGLILQVHGLVSGLTAIENVALPLQAARASPGHQRCVSPTLDLVGLADDGERLVDELSGGERQHVGIARALAGEPRIVIADGRRRNSTRTIGRTCFPCSWSGHPNRRSSLLHQTIQQSSPASHVWSNSKRVVFGQSVRHRGSQRCPALTHQQRPAECKA